jgi:hypothetical protein
MWIAKNDIQKITNFSLEFLCLHIKVAAFSSLMIWIFTMCKWSHLRETLNG